MAASRQTAVASRDAGPRTDSRQKPLDIRLEHVGPWTPPRPADALPTFGGLLRYSVGEALTAVDRTFDLVITLGEPPTREGFLLRMAYHRKNGTPCIGIFLADDAPAIPGALRVAPACWRTTLETLVHNLFAPFLIGIVCVDWNDVLAVLDAQRPLVLVYGESNDAGELGARLGVPNTGRFTAAHAVLYAPGRLMLLRDIRAFANGARGSAAAEQSMFVYSAPDGQIGEQRYWGCLLGAVQ